MSVCLGGKRKDRKKRRQSRKVRLGVLMDKENRDLSAERW